VAIAVTYTLPIDRSSEPIQPIYYFSVPADSNTLDSGFLLSKLATMDASPEIQSWLIKDVQYVHA
jgi:hypothetical protein